MKFLLIDADGVLLKKVEYFSARFAREQNIPEDTVTAFFKNEFRLCQEGKADLKYEIQKYLESWKWVGTVDHLLEHWFSSDVNVNLDLQPSIMALRKAGVKCYLAANQEEYRATYIRKELAQHSLVDGYLFSYELGHRKLNREFFEKSLIQIVALPGEVLYVDNDEANIAAARSCGIDSMSYRDGLFEDLAAKL